MRRAVSAAAYVKRRTGVNVVVEVAPDGTIRFVPATGDEKETTSGGSTPPRKVIVL